jgi:hypothetical protein
MVVRDLPEFKEVLNSAREARMELAAFKFQAKHPEFTTLAPQVQQGVVGAIAKTQQKYNLSATADGLEAAYFLAQREGLIPNFSAPPPPPPVPHNAPQNNPYLDNYGNLAAPPVINRGGGGDAGVTTEEQMEAMTDAQLERLAALQSLGRR